MKQRQKIWNIIQTKILGAKVRYRMLILYLVKDTGMADAEQMLTDIIKERVALSEE